MLDEKRGIQWPLREGETVAKRAERRLFEDGKYYHADGRAKMLFEEPKALPEETSEKYPFTLLTGRGTSAQWHTQTRTAKSDVLRSLYSEDPYVEINPKDARELSALPNDWVVVESARGKMRARAYVTQIVPPGQLFIPMHYEETNRLTFPAFDPYSRQPSYKACAVRVVVG
jgi:assimilatory nitrate reductase catalytic subunit